MYYLLRSDRWIKIYIDIEVEGPSGPSTRCVSGFYTISLKYRNMQQTFKRTITTVLLPYVYISIFSVHDIYLVYSNPDCVPLLCSAREHNQTLHLLQSSSLQSST
jgi:hypothetical protein